VLRLTSILLAALLLPACTHATAPGKGCSADDLEHGARLQRTVTVAGSERHYILEVPAAVTPGQPVPLILAFHGWGHSGEGVWKASRFRELRDTGPFLTAYPEGLPVALLGNEARAGWEIKSLEGNRDLAFVNAMIDDIERSHCVDPRRIYASGFSNGGWLSHMLGCALSDRIAAIAPVGGGDLLVACTPERPVPVIIHHGTRDGVVPLAHARAASQGWARRNGCGEAVSEGNCQRYQGCRQGAEVIFCEEDIAHLWPPAATQRVWDFFARHPRK